MADLIDVRLETPRVEVGGEVKGQVYFLDENSKLDRCKQVQIECRAHIHGSGNTEHVTVGDKLVRDGPIEVPLRVPFSFRIPARGPVSFQGRYVKIDWEIEVRLDVPWAVDPKMTVCFDVVPKAVRAEGEWEVPSGSAA